MTTLNNGMISISVKEHGAELCSIICEGREYLWQADERFWKRHSPVLFPIVGSVWNKQFRSHGKTFGMGQHGIARDMDFTLKSESADEVWYYLESSAETLEKYPYSFRLEIGYRLRGRSVDVMWRVINPSGERMYFQIGAHPAFHWPQLSTGAIAAGTDAMCSELQDSGRRGWFLLEPMRAEMPKSVIGKAGTVDPALSSTEVTDQGFVPITTTTFDHDALIFEDCLVKRVVLCTQDRKPYLSLETEAPVMGLWSPPGKNAPFVCIEPWYGRTDFVDYDGDFEHKPWIQELEPGAEFSSCYTITVH